MEATHERIGGTTQKDWRHHTKGLEAPPQKAWNLDHSAGTWPLKIGLRQSKLLLFLEDDSANTRNKRGATARPGKTPDPATWVYLNFTSRL